MQVPEMKAMRALYTRTPKPFSFIAFPNPRFPRRVPRCSHQFHSSNPRFIDSPEIKADSGESGPSSKNGRAVWTVYDPAVGGLTTRRVTKKDREGQELESNLSSSDDGVADLERGRTYGSARKGYFSGGDDVVDGSLKERKNVNIKKASSDDGVEDLERERTYGSAGKGYFSGGDDVADGSLKERRNVNLKKASSVSGLGVGDVVGIKRKGKGTKVSWVCADCGYSNGQWWGTCLSCGGVGTMKQFSEAAHGGGGGSGSGIQVSEHVMRKWLPQAPGDVQPLRLTDVNRGINQLDWRIPLPGPFGSEVARVLGGGLAPGSLVLIGGDPGVGKSTLVLQVAALIAEGRRVGESAPVVYVSGEESLEQIVNRADRMMIGTGDLFLYSSTDIEDILAKIQNLSPHALIVDSIQTVYLKGVTGSPGGLTQVKECTSALLRFAKRTNVPVFLIGHVNKSGDIAGPRVLEHIVDVVLYMEGEKYSSHRLLRPVKNRFGSTDELGVFEMSESGLQVVSNPSEIFLSEQHSDSAVFAGLAVAVVMDGSRSFLIEIQALCVSGTTVLRHINGIQASRADMIISVLMKQAGLKLQENAIFLNVVSGVMLKETSGDLAIAVAICSSFLEFPIPNSIAFIGEIGLGGELRSVPRMEKRVNTVAKLGYKMCIVPKSALKSLAILGYEDIKIIGCKNLKEVINAVFSM
ncbi:hypothetical protein HS088_TW10G00645 [Tripterygium wilfordii]|uniref:RecA family profile 1 domain-containing protein n=1 Tax=Tripterygium wilfordii TaxID=458696 RepID=A0A7J7D5Q8_TRIWF|nr:DNA repair protein RadA [Tripterygium wilfordii]KAF5741641.1 hypothetical protein HS088_TW10G00645 [Tripterygium wilfordii]